MAHSEKTSKRNPIVAGLVLSFLLSLVPQTLLARAPSCYNAGSHPWIDGYTYCMVSGNDCYYCEVRP